MIFRFRVKENRLLLFAVLAEPAEYRIFSVVLFRDHRKNALPFLQFLPCEPEPFRLEFIIRGNLPEKRIPDLLLSDGIFVHDTAEIHLGIVVFGNCRKAEKTAVPGGIHLCQIAENDHGSAHPFLQLRFWNRNVFLLRTDCRINDRHRFRTDKLPAVRHQNPCIIFQPDQNRAGISFQHFRIREELRSELLFI